MSAVAGLEARELGISWSRLREHMECHQKAYQKSQGRKGPAADIRVFFPGTVVDRCMRMWLNSDDPPAGGMSAILDTVLDTEETEAQRTGDGVVRWRHASDKDEVRVWCRDLLTRLEPILREEALPFDYEPALRFRVPVTIPYLDGSPQRIWLAGELDLLVRCGSSPDTYAYRVWDLKGTNNTGYWRKVVGQLLFYDLAMACKFGKYPEMSGLIQPMCADPVLRFVFTDQDRAELFSQLVRYCNDIWRRDFAPKADEAGCLYCEVRHACVKYPAAPGRVPWPVTAA